MKDYVIDTTEVEAQAKDWGSLKPLFEGATLKSKSGFSMSLITYSQPHYSGSHTDHEIIYILNGRGTATIGGRQLMFRSGHLLAIPMNTEHGISKIEEGPVRAILVHFT